MGVYQSTKTSDGDIEMDGNPVDKILQTGNYASSPCTGLLRKPPLEKQLELQGQKTE